MTSISVHDSDGVKTVDTSLKAKDSALKAKTKDFKIVLDPRGWWLVLEDSNTGAWAAMTK